MKKIKMVLSTALTLAVTLTACEQQPAQGNGKPPEASVVQAKEPGLILFALDVGVAPNPDGTVVPLTRFLPDEKIIASLRTQGAAKAVPVTVKLVQMSNGQVAGEQRRELTLSGAAATNFEFVKQGAGQWAVGRYVVEVSIAGKAAGRQEIEVTAALPEGARPKPPGAALPGT